ncbi:MAG: DUF4336 domain-containing protein [Myxococcota bacterium]
MSSRLRALDEGLWVVDHPLVVGGLHLGTRSTVVQLTGGGVVVHSPGPLDPGLAEELEKLGPVRALIAPNRLHHLSLAGAGRAFPAARVFGAPGLAAKQPDLHLDEELGDEPPELWKTDLTQHCFGGAPRLSEVVFHHPASRSLLLTDLAFHVLHSDSRLTRVAMWLNDGYGRFGPTRLLRRTIRDRAAARASLELVLSWDFERVIVTHGEVLESGGREALRAAYAWLE